MACDIQKLVIVLVTCVDGRTGRRVAADRPRKRTCSPIRNLSPFTSVFLVDH